MMKLLIFDYDKTIAKPKSKPSSKMIETFSTLLQRNYVAVLTGGRSFEELNRLLVQYIQKDLLKNLYLCPEYGSKIYVFKNAFIPLRNEKRLSSRQIKEIGRIAKGLDWKKYNVSQIYGEQIKHRGTSVSIDCLGQDAPDCVKNVWDRDFKYRKIIKRDLEEVWGKKYDIYATGRNTLDIVMKGYSKADTVKRLCELLKVPLKECVFVGDEFEVYGNDYSTLELDDIKVYMTKGPEDTLLFMHKNLLKQD